MSPYCDIHGGYVLNATIDRYAYAVIKTRDDRRVRFVATDQQVEELLAKVKAKSEEMKSEVKDVEFRALYDDVVSRKGIQT